MNNHRVRGLNALNKTVLAIAIFGWFWMALYVWESLLQMPVIGLPWNYAFISSVAVFSSTFGSQEGLDHFTVRSTWHRLIGSARKTNFQVAVIAFFVFAAYFATDVKETSRLFLGFFIATSWGSLLFMNFSDTSPEPDERQT